MDDTLDRFDAGFAGRYDRGIRLAVPGYEALHGMAHALLRLDAGERARLLVAGSGTGAEILTLGSLEPGWSFTGVDPSPDMTAVARRRVANRGLAPRTGFHTGYVADLPERPRFDAATAILVMHFLPDDGRKLDFLLSIAARLRPGAPLVLVDLRGDPDSEPFDRLIGAWKIRQRAIGMEETDVEEMFRDMANVVRFVPENRILSLLQEAGFANPQRFYNAMLFGGWTARKR